MRLKIKIYTSGIMVKSKRFGPKRLGASKSRVTTRAVPNKKATVALVKQVLSKEIETKFRSQAPMIVSNRNAIVTNNDIRSLIPPMDQTGATDPGNSYERMGQKITPRKLRCSAYISLNPGITRSTNVVVCWWALTHKSIKHYPDLLPTANQDISTKFFKTGDFNQTYGFDGIVLNSTFPVNDNEYTVLKKGKFLLGKNTGVVQDVLTAGNQPVYGNHTGRMVEFDVKTPAKLLYDQDNGSPKTVQYPNNFAPFMVVGYYHQDQTQGDEANADIAITMRTSLWYDDA